MLNKGQTFKGSFFCLLKNFSIVLLLFFCFSGHSKVTNSISKNVFSKRFFPAFFIPNESTKNEKSKIIETDGSDVVAFIQTFSGRVMFTPQGLYWGTVYTKRNDEQDDLPVENKLDSKSSLVNPSESDSSDISGICVASLGFLNNKDKSVKSIMPVLEEKTGGKVNFLIGKRENWHTNISMYKKLVYKNVWDGIDVEYVGYMDKLEYRVIVNAGANPKNVLMQLGGDKIVLDKEGNVVVYIGENKFLMTKPYAYQIINGVKKEVDISYKISENNTFSFVIGEYNLDYQLIIDPILTWSSFLGGTGTGYTEAQDVFVDDEGFVYLTGYTYSNVFPVTSNAFQKKIGIDSSFPKDNADAFIMKISPDLSELVYSSYLGGENGDYGKKIIVDSSGSIYVAGYTYSSDFPLTQDAIVEKFHYSEGFLVKINPDNGEVLQYSTFIGGSGYDKVNDLFIDSDENIFIVGDTKSSDFPVTEGGIPSNASYYEYDGFICEFNTNCELILSTCLGKDNAVSVTSIFVKDNRYAYLIENFDDDYALAKFNLSTKTFDFETIIDKANPRALFVDSSGYVYLAGGAYSGFTTTGGVYQPTANSSYDAFVAKYNSSGYMVFGTFLGGSGSDDIYDICVDSNKNIYVSGETSSYDFPISTGTYLSGGDAFIAKLSASGTMLYFSSVFGGSDLDTGYALALDKDYNIYVAGTTRSIDFPVTEGVFDAPKLGVKSAFIAKFNKLGIRLNSNYFGSGDNSENYATGVVCDANGNVYVAGCTVSTDFPTTPDVFQEYNIDFADSFLMKLNSSCDKIIYSTYFGGSGSDYIYAIDLDEDGFLYFGGSSTNSSDLPWTSSFGGFGGIFVGKLLPDGSDLEYLDVFEGNSSSGNDGINKIVVTKEKEVVFCGFTYSEDFPVTENVFQTSFGGGSVDAVIGKLNASGDNLEFATFLGGREDETAYNVDVADNGDIFVCGWTKSASQDSVTFPITSNAFQSKPTGSFNYGGYLTVLSSDGRTLKYSTLLTGTSSYGTANCVIHDKFGNVYIGGYLDTAEGFPFTEDAFNSGDYNGFILKISPDNWDLVYATSFPHVRYLAIDDNGYLYVVGRVYNSDIPVTENAFQKYFFGTVDAFVAQLDLENSSLIYSSFLGGFGYDYVSGICLDKEGNLYCSGLTESYNFPVTEDAMFSENFYDSQAAFISKFHLSNKVALPLSNSFVKNVVTNFVNSLNVSDVLYLNFMDSDGNIVDRVSYDLPPNGKLVFNQEDFSSIDFSNVIAEFNSEIVAFCNVKTENGEMTAYLDGDFASNLFVPHIAESTNYWESMAYVSIFSPGELSVSIANQDNALNLEDYCSLVNLENYLGDDFAREQTWGQFNSGSSDNDENFTGGAVGFEMFVHNGTDGAAVELQKKGSKRLYIPHIPLETDIFWTGFAIVNIEDEDAQVLFRFYNTVGNYLGEKKVVIPAKTKYIGLMKDLFPEYYGDAEWGIIDSDKDLVGIEIYGTPQNAICGYSLPVDAKSIGLFPEIVSGENLWSGIALTNIGDEVANVEIKLYDKDGNYKGSYEREIYPYRRFKAVVEDMFPNIELQTGDYLKFVSDNPLIGIIVNGDTDRTFMTALTDRF